MASGPYRKLRGLLACIMLLALAPAVAAQSITDARRVEFTPSADHNAVDQATGQPLVTKYTVDVYVAGGATVVSNADLGKPTPQTDGMIRVDFVALLTTALTPGVVYESIVSAVGPGGTASTGRSNTFAFTPPCAPAISPTSSNLATSAAATGSVTVTAGTGCTWTAASNVGWITINAGTAGTGNGTVSYSVAANAGTTSRTGTMTIGGQTFSVTQAGAPCTFTISPASSNLTTSAAATGTVTVTAGTGCGWTAASNVGWMTISAGTSGSGNGSVSYSVAANAGTTSRTGTMTIGGQTFNVTQAGAPCTFTISPTSSNLTSSLAASGSVAVTAGAGCGWTATSNDSWITIGSGGNGTGNGNVTYNVTANTSTASRTGTLTVGGNTFTITQPGAPCAFTILPSSSTLSTSVATSGTVNVTAGAGCTWTATSNAAWITVTAGASGNGNGTLSYDVAANAGSSSRTGTVTIAGQTFTVNQAGAPCTFTISPVSADFTTSVATTGTVNVTASAGCTWAATTNVGWISVTAGANGTGNGTVSYSVGANTAAGSRTGTLTIAGQTFTVNQAGAPCTFSISPTSSNLASAAATTGVVTVSSGTGCNWNSTSNDSWLTITSGATGSGGGTVNYSVAANTVTSPRSGSMTIAGQTYSVTQAAAACSFTISPTSQTLPASGGPGTVTVTTASNCSWTSSSGATWVTITSGASGTGNGTVGYTAGSNTGTTGRSTTLTIAGRSFTVSEPSASCTFSISPSLITAAPGGSTGTLTITTASNCAWTTSSNAAWVTVSGSGTGSGTATYTVSANTGSIARSALLNVGGVFVGVNQSALTVPTAPTNLRVIK